jgi:hypothetical protein
MEPEMTYTEIDPAVVRTIAEAALHSTVSDDRAERVESALIASGVAGPVLSEGFDAWSKAVGAEYDRLTAERDATATGGHYSRILDFVENLPSEGDAIAGYIRNGKQYKLTAADLRGLLDDYSAAVQSMVKIENIITVFDERGA